MPLNRFREPFSSADWIFELKYDGFRALAEIEYGRCRLVSRNGNAFGTFQDLALRIGEMFPDNRAVLAGEIALEEIKGILAHLPEPAATAFAIAAYAGLRVGEIEGLDWDEYLDGEIHVSRSVWNTQFVYPKTRKTRAPVPIIRHLAGRLELHRLRCGSPVKGPMFTTTKRTRLSMHNVRERQILPALNRCVLCHKAEDEHAKVDHKYGRDSRIPEWHGWHACRRGLGSNLNKLGVDDSVIQRILRHSNIATTQAFYIKTLAPDVREAMTKLENSIPKSELDTNWTPDSASTKPN